MRRSRKGCWRSASAWPLGGGRDLRRGDHSTFKSTNPIESMISVARTVTGNDKRWRDGRMNLRWTAAGVLEAEKQFRRVNGYRDLQAPHRVGQNLAANRRQSERL